MSSTFSGNYEAFPSNHWRKASSSLTNGSLINELMTAWIFKKSPIPQRITLHSSPLHNDGGFWWWILPSSVTHTLVLVTREHYWFSEPLFCVFHTLFCVFHTLFLCVSTAPQKGLIYSVVKYKLSCKYILLQMINMHELTLTYVISIK